MTLSDFADQHDFPARKTRRHVRAAVREAAWREHHAPAKISPTATFPDHTDPPGPWTVDLTDEVGVQAQRKEGGQYVQLEVTAPWQLEGWMIQRLGTGRLRAEDLDLLARAARAYRAALVRAGGRPERTPRRLREVGDLDAERLDRVLRRIGY